MHLISILVSIALFSMSAFAEDINTIFQNVNKFVTERNYSKALQELTWAKKEIEKLHSARIQEFFPATLGGMKGEPIEAGSALGIMNVERKYIGDNDTVTVSLTGGSSGEAASGFAGLAQLGAMAAAFGGMDPSSETFRVGGRTAVLRNPSNGASAELTLTLQSGSLLKLSATKEGTKGETLKKMLEEIKIEELDSYLKAA